MLVSHIMDVACSNYICTTNIHTILSILFNAHEVIIQKKYLIREYAVWDVTNNAQTEILSGTHKLHWSDTNSEKVFLDLYISTLGMPLDQSAFKDCSSYTIYSWVGKEHAQTYHSLYVFFMYKVIKINHYQINSDPKHNQQQC